MQRKPKKEERRNDDSEVVRHDDSVNEERRSPENEPGVDRGERIATGKAIARGGLDEGFVPGAQADK